MSKTILITGATDGIGLETAKMLVAQGHHVLLHGRSPEKLAQVETALSDMGKVEGYLADLSDMNAVKTLAHTIADNHQTLDVLTNNAGVLKTPHTTTKDGLDIRFAVNTIAPYLLTNLLLPLMNAQSRVVNLSSAAQSPVDVDALAGKAGALQAMEAYAQSKLALTMWSLAMAEAEPMVVAVNPGSLLGSKMVKEGFGTAGQDLSIGANILVRAALSDEFSGASGKYFDNDSGRFANPHPDALDQQKRQQVVDAIENFL